MYLSHLLHNRLKPLQIVGDMTIAIDSIAINSALVAKGTLFIAVKGTTVDGHNYIDNAIEKGAVAIVCETLPQELKPNIAYIQVSDSALAAGLIAAYYYGNPSHSLIVVGVTGTNGKTSIATLLYQLYTRLGYVCGLISTVQNHIGSRIVPSTHTTPDVITLQRLLAEMKSAGCTYVFMECSSHAIHQKRIAGIRFAGGVFTNITHDHIDYHGTFEAYIQAKKQFFDDLPATAFALSNEDDKRGRVMLQNTKARPYYYSLLSPANFKGKVVENHITGLQLSINGKEAHYNMVGSFNAYNLLAVYGVAELLGESAENIIIALSSLKGAEGRFQTYISPKEQILGIVDYAHTPDALINVLATVEKLNIGGGAIYIVIGCGGNRDTAKRPLMAEVACKYSTKAIFTSDNPRNEDPNAILKDMTTGLKPSFAAKYMVIPDRKEAIKTACMLAKPGDIILVAGKGHEKTQEIAGVKHPFSDYQVLIDMFKLIDK
ncbi:MAG: UDP-N-acetylmuramoyl-L-alanyl-D-glutamate--2,6-diaminopimelate ligase [Chitinophagia bacterium]|nr:UDP-N-acetylmuramoyl-L-alanyl-D-glutamate--2,6-diaminopimelate ligase [Chitinophagia bacterium]